MKTIVSIQGVKGAFHHQAAMKYLGADLSILECRNFNEVVHTVEIGDSEFGVMAIENSLVGNILQNYSLIRESAVQVVGEVYLRIVQNLMALPGESIDTIYEVHSHPMALAQCERYLSNRKGLRVISSNDTATSAKAIAEKRIRGVAAIASLEAASEYGLEVINASIESNKSNFTRFLVLTQGAVDLNKDQANKASLVFSLPHQPGSLAGVLRILSDHDINLTMLQSLPQVGNCWEYYFHVDMTFHHISIFNKVRILLEEQTAYLKTIGVYNSGKL